MNPRLIIGTLLAIISMCKVTTGQEVYLTLNDIQLVCNYNYQIQVDSTDRNSIKDLDMVLQIGNGVSKFSSSTQIYIDSACYITQGMDLNQAAELIIPNIMGRKPTTYLCKYSVYKNYPRNGQYTMNSTLSKDVRLQIVESMDIQWETVGGDSVILGYRCNRAKTNFAGRDYTAWFTTEIPVNEGPYKFSGLPGLIVKISDTKQQHVFTLTGVASRKAPSPIIYFLSNGVVNISAQEYPKSIENYLSTLIHDAQIGEGNLGSISVESRTRAVAKFKRMNNFIELY